MKTKTILNHEMVRIDFTGTAYELYLCMQTGEWIRHNPFPGNQMGLVSAVSLAAEVLAGKFWLMERADIGASPKLNAPPPVMLNGGMKK